jgi:hypothetical protein
MTAESVLPWVLIGPAGRIYIAPEIAILCRPCLRLLHSYS